LCLLLLVLLLLLLLLVLVLVLLVLVLVLVLLVLLLLLPQLAAHLFGPGKARRAAAAAGGPSCPAIQALLRSALLLGTGPARPGASCAGTGAHGHCQTAWMEPAQQ
jgi:hypothetical protein